MKHPYIISTVLFSFLVFDTAGASVAARRTAVVVQGPAGGVVVGASRTAVVRPAYGFVYNRDASGKATSNDSALVKAAAEKASEPHLIALGTSH